MEKRKLTSEVVKKYDEAGLKIDHERVLTYSQLSCPLECAYCFVNDMTTNQQKEVAYLTENQIDLLENLPEEIRLIMLGCDTEFFQNKPQSLDILRRISKFGRDISMITKIPISEVMVADIKRIYDEMKSRGNFLSVSMSLPCISEKMLAKYEPQTPAPERRLATLKIISENEIPAMLAIRPLLPDISVGELEEIVALSRDFVVGYYSGPLYLNDDRIAKLLPETIVEQEARQPHWMLDGNTFKEIKKEGQIEFLKSTVEKSGRQFFEGAADGMKYLRGNIK
ncbi:MAG: hypothetical protein A3I39_02350 [Candidatus Yanofskybacteria bacterium RIFCSPLOWO2_02_FULL_47_9b]|uniref:Radical SAM core domain-containing protein n=1 Tax=Candidatus Yanofskybacteria bacterium RIFCSPLOWO2_02_FULL_47_9b TaxID=1802708 RepID=A0A1F8H7C4_9BACT|nr:MAG: hypothetical protein A3I39_02350 [Candidatus Yanofskybacteria bacterium RIFCSPLOWO2_02_FULL_47_9b]